MIYERDGAAFASALMKLAMVYNLDRSPELIAIWWEALCDLELPAVDNAVRQFIRGTEEFPTPGKIRALAVNEDADESAKAKARSDLQELIRQQIAEREAIARQKAERKQRLEASSASTVKG